MMVLAGVIALFVLPVAIAVIRVATRRAPAPTRRIPLSAPIVVEVEPPDPFDDQIETYLRGAMSATGTRLPTSPARTPRASTPPPPPRAQTPVSDFDDEPVTKVSIRPYRQ